MNIEQAFNKLRNEGIEPVTSRVILDIYAYLIGMNAERLSQITTDKTLPIVFRILAKELLSNKGLSVVMKVLDSGYTTESEQKESAEPQRIVINVVQPKELLPRDDSI